MNQLDSVRQCIAIDLRNKKHWRQGMNGYAPTFAGQSKRRARSVNHKAFKDTLIRLKYLRRLEKAYA